MSYWRLSIMEESQLEDLVAKGLLPPKAAAHCRVPLVEHEELHPEPRKELEAPFPAFTGARPVKPNSWTWGPPTSEKGRMAFLERALWKRVTEEGLDRVRLFSTIRARRVIPLAVRTTKMWEYTGPSDPDRVSPEDMPDDNVWSWVEFVLKVGNQQTIGGLDAFDKGHLPNLDSVVLNPVCICLRGQPAQPSKPLEASLAKKKKRAEKDRDVVKEEYELEPSTDYDDGGCSEEEESEWGNADSFMVKPRGTTGSEIPEGSGMSASALEVRKLVAEGNAAPTEEAKLARVEKHSRAPQMPSPSGQRAGPEARSMMTKLTDPPCDLQNTDPRESAGSAPGLSHAMGHGLGSPPGVWSDSMMVTLGDDVEHVPWRPSLGWFAPTQGWG
ncbi:hypothetical protein C2845_PM10G12180 [Panicum miliaceum]|uniref:Uncharacterized protein n=1 Tax=Panicum miliaceum TaxID=4540 RepID=A0A3L6PEH0_PANMI|nr:hypothetical protein C2845_PM10G12180 [Panicum miliaceum]